MPKTTLGKWSVGLIITFVVFFVSFQLFVAIGQRGGETFFSALILTVPIIIVGISGISALVTGLIGVIWSKERSVIVYLAIAIGFLVLVFGFGEVMFPH